VFAHCLYCKGHLGGNYYVEMFPVGRRLAFDGARGRLWVVCTRCTRWNLSPLEERWEAIEMCERLFRDARRRVSTENIGFARLPEGLDLVRIGSPQRPELAAWRYGDQLRRRRRRYRVEQAANIVAVSSGFIGFMPASTVLDLHRNRRVVARVNDGAGEPLAITRKQAKAVRLRPADNEHGWLIAVPHRDRQVEVHGSEAVRLAGLLLPHVNRQGANAELVEQAVREIERAGGAEPFFRIAADRVDKHEAWALIGKYDHRLIKSPIELRLALEMAAHEEAERRALEGELALLEQDWREAEEIAAIADDLLVPRAVRVALERLRLRGAGIDSPAPRRHGADVE
jgi:hypothetical protein